MELEYNNWSDRSMFKPRLKNNKILLCNSYNGNLFQIKQKLFVVEFILVQDWQIDQQV